MSSASSKIAFDLKSIAADSLSDMEERFGDVSKVINLPVPSEIMSTRFQIEVGSNGERYFKYRVRESFRALVTKVFDFAGRDETSVSTLRYVGNIGAGKSHNLAALVDYLRSHRKDPSSGFVLDTVYISSCRLLFVDDVDNLKLVLCEAFPAEVDEISACKDWIGIKNYVKNKPKKSIIFIYDDWNYVEPELKLIPEERAERLVFRRMLLQLATGQYCIQAISAGSDSSTERSKPINTDFYIFLEG
jgi:hypothetical protein